MNKQPTAQYEDNKGKITSLKKKDKIYLWKIIYYETE